MPSYNTVRPSEDSKFRERARLHLARVLRPPPRCALRLVQLNMPTYFTFFLQLLPRQISELIEPLVPLGVGGGAPTQREAFLASCMSVSFCCSVGLLLIWRVVIAPAIPAYNTRSSSDKVFLSNSFVSMFTAVAAPVLAVLAMRSVPWGDVERVMNTPPDDYAVRAVGLSCGYMLYDTLFCLYYKELRSPLMIAHHVLPVLFWPYCLLWDKVVPLILFFVLTELTNVGQHGRILLLKFGLESSRLYAIVGTSWVAVFFLIRIAPSPYLFYEIVNGNYSAYSSVEYGCVFFTTPLPFILNSYWFYLLFNSVIRFLEGKRRLSDQRRAEAIAAEIALSESRLPRAPPSRQKQR